MDESNLLTSLHKENIVPNLSHLAETLKSSSLPSSVKPKRGQWYSPCNSPRPKQPLSPDDGLPILKLNHFEKTPRVLFGNVKFGSSKIEELVVWNPHPVSQTLRVEKSPSKRGFTLVCSDDGESPLLTLEADEEVVLPIKWVPSEAGKCREMIIFKWNETHRLQAIVMGTAVDTKTKKKRRSVLCNSQVFNTQAVKKPFKPHFSVVTKDPLPAQEKPTVLVFGKSIPDFKEVPEEDGDERRETYVVTSVPSQSTITQNKGGFTVKSADTGKKENKASIDKQMPFDLQVEFNKDNDRRETYIQSTNSNQCHSKPDTITSKTHVPTSQGTTTIKCDDTKCQQPHMDKDVEGKENDKIEKLVSTKTMTVTEKSKGHTDTVVEKKEKEILPPVAFDVGPKKKPEKQKLSEKMKQRRKDTTRNKKTLSVKKTRKVKLKVAAKGVAPTKLKLVKPPKTSIPRHPMPFAAKNMYYDERWIEKQEQGFTRWLNFMLTPPDDCEVMCQSHPKKDPGSMSMFTTKSMTSSQPKAPSKEELSLKAYTARRKMARLRRAACLLYQSEPVVYIITKIEAEVEHRRLSIRPDKKIHADLGIKRNIVKMILSYNPLWLRIGLEIIYGEIMPIQSNSDVSGLARFVTDRLLGNPDIARAYAHPKVPGLYKEGYVEHLAKFTLKKFLFLVLFLDRAKLTRIIDHDPCLFDKNAEFKSSRSLLLTFSREYLRGEGDLTKHLSYLGFSVTHQQRAIDEFDYAVTNIATDLRDGLRLTRVVELLTHNWQLTQNLRVPTISRLQKIHNVEVFMEALTEHKIPVGDGESSTINPRHVVDGHREKTLQLLWLIIFNFQVNVVLNEKQLREEITFLEQKQDLQNRLTTMAVDGSTILGLPRSKRESLENDIYFKSTRLSLLLKWCKLVCRQYGLKVENFTVSFSDGRALCYLLHFYHPSLLPLSSIKQDTTLTRNPGVQDDVDSEEEEGIVRDSWAGSYSPGSGTNTDIERLKANERENFKALAEKVQDLGGVPLMTKFSDMSNTIPDEKVVITYTAYLCARLLDLRDETRAARKIQMAWKQYQLKKHLQRRQALVKAVVIVQAYGRGALVRRRYVRLVKSTVIIQAAYRGYKVRHEFKQRAEAARRIQQAFRATRTMCRARTEFLRYKKAVIDIQTLFRGQQCRRVIRRNQAAVVIQALWRCYTVRSCFVTMRNATVTCQKCARGWLQRKRFVDTKAAVIVLQTRFRAWRAQRKERQGFLTLKQAAITVQAAYRGYKARSFAKKVRAVVVLQKTYKMKRQRARYVLQREAAIKIQSQTRRYFAITKYTEVRTAAIKLQTLYRAYRSGHQQRLVYFNIRSSCVKMQSIWRGHSLRKRYLLLKGSTVKIQAVLRRTIVQAKYKRLQRSALTIQRYYRGNQIMKAVQYEFQAKKSAAVAIQSFYRQYRCRASFLKTRIAVIRIQACFRGHVERARYLALKDAAIDLQRRYLALRQGRHQCLVYHIQKGALITIQAAVRGFLVRQDVKRQRRAATVIQKTFRSFIARKKYQATKSSAILIQRRYRAYMFGEAVRLHYQTTRQAVITVQAYYRGHRIRQEIKYWHSSAITIQAMYKCHLLKTRYSNIKKAVSVLQTRYRAARQAQLQAEQYRKTRSAAVIIQAYYRGARVRREVHLQHRSAVTIQAYYRGTRVRREVRLQHRSAVTIQANYRRHIAQSRYQSLKQATAVLQTRYRAIKQGRKERQHYQLVRSFAIVLQAAFRGHQARRLYKKLKAVVSLQSVVRGFIVRRDVKQMNVAAVKIQSAYRGHIAFQRYVMVKQAIVIIQTRYHAYKLGKQTANRYQALKQAVIVLQAAYRGYRSRLKVKRIIAAIAIQSRYRGYVARRDFISTKTAAIAIQSRYRGYTARREFISTKTAAIAIQSCYRGYTVRRDFISTKTAAIAIQSRYRGYVARRDFISTKTAAIAIQSRYRGYVARRDFISTKTAAIAIQSRYRGYTARRDFISTKTAAIAIQSRYRGYTARRDFISTKTAAIAIQSRYRGYTARRDFISTKTAAIAIQSRYRGYVSRRDFISTKTAAIAIQSRYRGYTARRDFISTKTAAIAIQSRYRGYTARRDFISTKTAAIAIQSRYRGYVARRDFISTKTAAIAIQSRYRGYVARRDFISTKTAAIAIQSRYRGYVSRRDFISTKTAAIAIQSRYRGYTARRDFISTKTAAIAIQSRYRGYTARRDFISTKTAAIAIQSRYRGYVSRRDFISTKTAAIAIQSRYRGYTARRDFISTKTAAIAIQSRYRGYVSRRDFISTKTAAIAIQSRYRGYTVRRDFISTKTAAIAIQSRYRGYVARRDFISTKTAAIAIQSRYRGYVARRDFISTKTVAIAIQSRYRGYVARRDFISTKTAAIAIQSRYRGYTARRDFISTKTAAIAIQSRYRGYTARRDFTSTKTAAISIQASVRCFLAAKHYKRLRMTAICMQRRYRANVLLLRQYMWYHIQRGACIVLQAAVRQHIARKAYLTLKDATVVIQQRYRALLAGRQQRQRYKAVKAATLTIQSFARGMKARKFVRANLAARTIQACYRMHSARTAYNTLRINAIRIQSCVRMVQERRRYTALKEAVLTIQIRYRAMRLGNAVKKNYQQIKAAVVVIQKFYRGYMDRKEIQRIRAAIKIQSRYKAYTARKEFLRYKDSVIVMQSCMRKALAVKRFQGLRKATVVCQTRYRAKKQMRQARSEYLLTKRSVIVIQSAVRQWRARIQYTVLKNAAVSLQTRYRAVLATKEQRHQYLTLRQAVIVIQAGYRALKARELVTKIRAARAIQAYYKMHVARVNFVAMRQAAVKSQSFVKMRKTRAQFLLLKSVALFCQRRVLANKVCKAHRDSYLRLRHSAVVLQSLQRGRIARYTVNKIIEERRSANDAASKIQRFYRGYKQMEENYFYYHYLRGAVITIQSHYRGDVARKQIARLRAAITIQAYYRGTVARQQYKTVRLSVIKIQAVVRCHLEMTRYSKLKHAALVCQQRYQATKAMQQQQQHYQQYKLAITKLQANWRSCKQRQRYKNTVQSIVLIQSVVRRFLVRKRFLQTREAVMVVQTRYRAMCTGRQVRQDYKQLRNVTIVIQSYYRGFMAKKYVRQILAARTIQRRYRAVRLGTSIRHEYMTMRASAVVIQASYRGQRGRQQALMHRAARTIQAAFRGFLTRRQLQKLQEEGRQRLARFTAAALHHLAAIKIQRSYRQARAVAVARKQMSSVLVIQCWWRAVLLRRRFLDLRSAAIIIQNASRRRLEQKHQAATRIQSLARVWLARRTVVKMNEAALRIQALWRGYQVRCRVKSLKVKTARRRIKAANDAATESLKLCNRTRSALDYLLRCKNLTTIFDVLVNLEVVTRLSYVCCEQLVNDQALHIILTVIRNSNRSLPHMEILKYSLAILINLAKCPTTYRAVYREPDSIATLLELITIFRGKEQIFSKTCCILTILARREDSILQDMINFPKMVEKVKGAHFLITRKCKLEKRRSAIKAKVAQGTPYKNAPPSTPFKQTPFKSHTPFKVKRRSEWAMWQDYVNKVQDPLQAVRSLLRTLKIDFE